MTSTASSLTINQSLAIFSAQINLIPQSMQERESGLCRYSSNQTQGARGNPLEGYGSRDKREALVLYEKTDTCPATFFPAISPSGTNVTQDISDYTYNQWGQSVSPRESKGLILDIVS